MEKTLNLLENAKKNHRKDSAELSSYTNNHLDKSCSYSSDATCGVRSGDTKGQIVEIAGFYNASDGFQFFESRGCFRNKNKISELTISIAILISYE